MKYFLYARKSTDEEERQVLSIEAQLAELKELAAKEKLEIADSLCESKTAKEPGRKIFGEMLSRIEKGEADGILAWHPDRLVRNSVDGGKIIYMVDIGQIKTLKFPTFWFENTPQGKFMLNIAFGQSKYYVDNLSENVKRGFRQKLRRGEYPNKAPIGYLNDRSTKTVLVDPLRAKLIVKMFEMYSSGDFSLKFLKDKFCDIGLTSKRGKNLTISMISNILSNPFYCGVFKFNGEIYQGKYEPIISKKLFDEVQAVMKDRGRPLGQDKHDYAFTGLMKCICGACITAERQKGHVYYRCTKKMGICDEKYIREENLLEQFHGLFQKASLPDDWIDSMLAKLDEEEKSAIKSSSGLIDEVKTQITATESKLDKLLDDRLEGLLDKDDYLRKKEQLINQKIDLEDKIQSIRQTGNNWLEPMREFLFANKQTKKVANDGDLLEIRAFIKKIGSNFILQGKKFEFKPKNGWNSVLNSENLNWLRDLDSNQDNSFQRAASYR
jgi:site-specific DNA recombinase